MSDRVTIDIANHIAEVTLNRPDKHNALDSDMFEAIISVGEDLVKDNSLRAVILNGAGNSFCAGIDITSFRGKGINEASENRMQPRKVSIANFYQSAAYVWREIPVPVITALHGAVFGGGFQIALGTDIRYARDDTQFSIMEIKWGIIPDMSITNTIPYLTSIDKALELAIKGKVFDGSEAIALELVTALKKDPLESSRALAKTIAEKSPDAIRAIKKLFYSSWNDSEKESLRREAELQIQVMSQPNQMEAVASAIENRSARFLDSII